MFSIGILGFIVWSLMALLFSDLEVTNISICWYSFIGFNTSNTTILGNNLNLDTSSASNLLFIASKTLKNSSSNISNFSDFYSHHFFVDPDWLTWFIGFTEGDGSIITDKNGRLFFVLTQNEESILLHIKSVLGFGNVVYGPNVLSYRYKVYDQESLHKLAYLFNGNLFLDNRMNLLASWINVLESKYYPISLNSTKFLPTLYDYWLSGFTDAEGCFNVSVYACATYTSGFRMNLRYLLDQKNKGALQYIAKLFNSGGVSLRSKTNGVYRYKIDSFNNTASVVKLRYLKDYPLKTKKFRAFVKWCNIRNMLLRQEHLTQSGLDRIRELAVKVNK